MLQGIGHGDALLFGDLVEGLLQVAQISGEVLRVAGADEVGIVHLLQHCFAILID